MRSSRYSTVSLSATNQCHHGYATAPALYIACLSYMVCPCSHAQFSSLGSAASPVFIHNSLFQTAKQLDLRPSRLERRL